MIEVLRVDSELKLVETVRKEMEELVKATETILGAVSAFFWYFQSALVRCR